MYVEQLAHHINAVVAKEKQGPIQIAKRCLELSHLFFADDIMLFVEASLNQVNVIHDMLNDFCQCSGQHVSYSKSLIHVLSNVNPTLAENISD